jgi:hypothetical protein
MHAYQNALYIDEALEMILYYKMIWKLAVMLKLNVVCRGRDFGFMGVSRSYQPARES